MRLFIGSDTLHHGVTFPWTGWNTRSHPLWGQETAVHLYQQHPATTRTCRDCPFTRLSTCRSWFPKRLSKSLQLFLVHPSFTCLCLSILELNDLIVGRFHPLNHSCIFCEVRSSWILAQISALLAFQACNPHCRSLETSGRVNPASIMPWCGMNEAVKMLQHIVPLYGDTTIRTSSSSIPPWSNHAK